jgi:hypothetical protein
MSSENGFLANVTQVIAQPKQFSSSFFTGKKGIILPLLLVIASVVVAQVVYFSSITLDDFVAFSLRGVPAEGYEQAAEGIRMMSLNTFMLFAAIGAAIAIPLVSALISVYYLIINRVSGTPEQSYGTWFAMSIWVSMPMIFIQLAYIVNVFISEPGSLAPEQLSLTSVNALITGLDFGEPLYQLFSQFDLISIWSIAITSLILMANKHRPASAIIFAALPTVLMLSATAVFGG